MSVTTRSSEQLASLARQAGFDLVGFARAEPIERSVLVSWVEAGYHADLDWMSMQLELRLDVTALLPGAKTVVALACNYWRDDAPSPIARYARTRDYHYTLRDRLRALRREVRLLWPEAKDYGSVDANPVMERVWAVRAGLGVVGKNGCLITPGFGSWVLLGALILDQEVDAYTRPALEDRCGSCRLCLSSCPTSAIVSDRVVDSRRCLSYQTIENEAAVPEDLRHAMREVVFGCDICQEVCPLNYAPVPAGERFAPRAVAEVTVHDLAQMSNGQYLRWATGTPLMRAGYLTLRRNALYALGAARDATARSLLERLLAQRDLDSPLEEAATWALRQLPPRSPLG